MKNCFKGWSQSTRLTVICYTCVYDGKKCRSGDVVLWNLLSSTSVAGILLQGRKVSTFTKCITVA